MPAKSPKSSKQLAVEYDDPDWQVKYVGFCDLMEILTQCIISADYHISDDINDALILSKAGTELVDRVHRREGIPVKEARLMCALTLGQVDLFVDIEATNVETLASAINKQMQSGDLRFPFVHGRDLYDAFAAKFDEEKQSLNNEHTHELLDSLPNGVIQQGRFVTGPLGLLESREGRIVANRRNVPAYHCSEPVCEKVHTTQLSTSPDAPINKHRETFRKFITNEAPEASEWWEFMRELTEHTAAFFADTEGGSVAYLIGDAFSVEELRLIVSDLISDRKNELRTRAGLIASTGDPVEISRKLDRAELIQLVLLCDEKSITATLDKLVHRKIIRIPQGEIRTTVTNSRARTGAFQLSAQIGRYGVRFVSTDPGLASLRLRRLLRKLYVQNIKTDLAELEWQLRGFDASNLDERLEEFFRSVDPETALRRLVLARKTNMITACEEAGIEDGELLDDDELVESLLWKLGFDVRLFDDPHRRLWDLNDRMTALTRASRISGIGDSETFLGVASNYFRELEGALEDSLSFAAWSLLTDHVAASKSFEFDEDRDRSGGFALLNASINNSSAEERFEFEAGKNSLYSLSRGFQLLSKHLGQLETSSGDLQRSDSEYPAFRGKTSLKDFVFEHTCPFLDLNPNSRLRIKRDLESISKKLVGAKVHEIRNDFAHFRRTDPEILKLEAAIEAVRFSLEKIEDLGFFRALYWPDSITVDAWGRSHHRFTGTRNLEQLFARPSSYDWMGLPALSDPQYIVRAAKFAEPNEILRFAPRYQSEYSKMWENYPLRRRKPEDILSQYEDAPDHSNGVSIAK